MTAPESTAPTVARDFGLTEELLAFLRKQEGLVLHPYRDQVGLPTIGYGHRIPTMEHAPLSPQDAENLLRADVRAKRDALLRCSPGLVHASPRRVAALIDFCFNCGEGAYKTSTLKRWVDVSDWARAAEQMTHWDHAGGRVLPELTARCAARARWLREG